jgi:type IV pilus assembly protein PilB
MLAQEALEEVLAAQKQDGRRLGVLLVERGLINETQLTQILSHQLSVPWVSLLHIEFSRQLLNLVPHTVAEKYCLVPIYVRHVRGQGETLYVAMDDPTNEDGLRECQTFSGLPVRAMIAPPSDIRSAIRVYYGGGVSKPPGPIAPSPSPNAAAPKPPPPPAADRPPQVSRTLPEAGALTKREGALTKGETAGAPSSVRRPPTDDGPVIETREIPVNRKGAERLQRLLSGEQDAPPPSSQRAVPIPVPKGKSPRMVALTLLDGTTLTLPAQGKGARVEGERKPAEVRFETGGGEDGGQLTARDLVAALRAIAHGADASEILGPNPSWEAMFAALLSLLLKKHLIADWEFVEEFRAAGGTRRTEGSGGASRG